MRVKAHDEVAIRDALGRALRDLRISITDRCNFRCTYCMPKEVFGKDYPFLPQHAVLTYEEIVRVVQLFERLGVRKIRLTGGEPLLRRDVERSGAHDCGSPRNRRYCHDHEWIAVDL